VCFDGSTSFAASTAPEPRRRFASSGSDVQTSLEEAIRAYFNSAHRSCSRTRDGDLHLNPIALWATSTPPPLARIARLVKHAQDRHSVAFRNEVDSVRKPPSHCPPDVVVNRRIDQRIGAERADHRIEFLAEPAAELRPDPIIPIARLTNVLFGTWSDPDGELHHFGNRSSRT